MAKKARKSNGEGSIIQLKNGLWQARISVRQPGGELKRIAFYGKTKKEAHEKLVKAQRETHTGSFVNPDKGSTREWINTWLTEYKKTRIRQSTFALYETINKTHIVPALGDIALQKLEAKDIQKLINSLSEKGKSASLIKQVHLLISGALKQAVKEQKVYRNVADAVELPQSPKKEIIPLNKEDAKKFLEAAKKSKYYPAFVLEMATALRRGELLALRWSDIDFDKGVLQVRQTLTRVAIPDGDKKTRLVFQAPKTKKSQRIIKLKDNIIRELKEYMLASGKRSNPEALVFTSKDGGPLDPRAFTKRYEYLIEKAGIQKISFHALRHTVAVLLLQAGEKVKNVQDLLGHEKYSTTMDIYADYVPDEEKEKTADKIDALLTEIM